MGMQGKTVLITGATQGIGKAAAIAIAKMGAQVSIVARDPARAEVARGEIAAAGGRVVRRRRYRQGRLGKEGRSRVV